MNLEKMNLVELNAQEVQEVDGGFWQAIAGALALSAIDHWPDIKKGFRMQ